MISRVRGALETVADNRVEVGSNDVVYEIMVPSYLAQELRGLKGEPVEFFTQHYIDGGTAGAAMVPRLVGFLAEADREFYRKLIKVPGLGSKMVLKAMVAPPGELARAIESEDKTALSELPGVGKRTAEKIVATLKGKVKEFVIEGAERIEAAPILGEMEEEALQVLLQLGYKRNEAEQAVRKALKKHPDLDQVDALVQAVFKDGGGSRK